MSPSNNSKLPAADFIRAVHALARARHDATALAQLQTYGAEAIDWIDEGRIPVPTGFDPRDFGDWLEGEVMGMFARKYPDRLIEKMKTPAFWAKRWGHINAALSTENATLLEMVVDELNSRSPYIKHRVLMALDVDERLHTPKAIANLRKLLRGRIVNQLRESPQEITALIKRIEARIL